MREKLSVSISSVLHGSMKVLASHSDISMISVGAGTVKVKRVACFSHSASGRMNSE